MEKHTIKKFSVWAVVAVCLSLSPVLWAQQKFQARMLPGLGPSSQRALKLIISVESYTSIEEISRLIEIANRIGYEQFRIAFRGMNKGSINPAGGRGVKIILHAAQNIKKDKGWQILLVAESQSLYLDSTLRFDSRFPFMVIELNFDKKWRGKGKIYEQANIQITSQGTIVMESSNSPPKQLFGVKVLE